MKTGKPLEVDPEDLAGKISVSYFKLIGLAKKVEVSNSPLIHYPTSERPLSFFCFISLRIRNTSGHESPASPSSFQLS